VVTTFAATVEPGGVSTRPEDASRALAAIDAVVADVAAGRRSLHAASRAASEASGTRLLQQQTPK
jgi:hypothetical protein